MSNSVEVTTSNGQLFFVEIDEGEVESADGQQGADGDLARELGMKGKAMGSVDKVLKKTTFSKAVDVIQSLAEEVSNGLLAAEPRPNEVELGLNLSFGAGGNVWLLKGSANANLKVLLKWKM